MGRRRLLQIVGGAAVAAAGGYQVYDRSQFGSTWEPRDGQLLSGVTPASQHFTQLDDFEAWLGGAHALVGLFVDTGASTQRIRQVVHGGFERIWARRQVPQVYWQPFLPDRESVSPTVASEIADGQYDETIQTWAGTLAEWAVRSQTPDRRLYINFAPEMTGDWSPWSPAVGADDEADFVRMWRHVHGIVMDTGLTRDHVQWIWAPDITNRGVDFDAVYPGDDYVDWVGIHGYNWANWGGWSDPEELYAELVDRIRSMTDRPIGLTEFSCSAETADGEVDPGRKAAWIEEAYALFERLDVRMALWFNVETDADWAVFGGAHGTDRVAVEETRYDVYPAYRRSVTEEGVLGPHSEHPRVLIGEEFAGEW